MKIYHISLIILGLGVSLVSCSEAEDSTEKVENQKEITKETAALSEGEITNLVAEIDEKRASIESNLGEPVILLTDGMRERVKQKWQKIHFYTANGQVVRIKTYPYETITNRTEEYYLNNKELILVVIEDEGGSDRGKAKDQLDKLYYFNDGKLIKEVHQTNESEYTLRDSDGEELLGELNEYLELFAKQK